MVTSWMGYVPGSLCFSLYRRSESTPYKSEHLSPFLPLFVGPSLEVKRLPLLIQSSPPLLKRSPKRTLGSKDLLPPLQGRNPYKNSRDLVGLDDGCQTSVLPLRYSLFSKP